MLIGFITLNAFNCDIYLQIVTDNLGLKTFFQIDQTNFNLVWNVTFHNLTYIRKCEKIHFFNEQTYNVYYFYIEFRPHYGCLLHTSPSFDARKKLISALDREITCQEFSVSDF